MSNATLTTIKEFQAEKPDLTITINRSDLEAVIMGKIQLLVHAPAAKPAPCSSLQLKSSDILANPA